MKRCPFCGSEAEEVLSSNGTPRIRCTQCGAGTLWGLPAAWNRRTKRETDLKPCPFCGGRGKIYETYDGSYVIQCRHCYITTNAYITLKGAKNAWNGRYYDYRRYI